MEWLLTLKNSTNVSWFAREKRLRLNIEENKIPTAGHIKLLGVEIDSKSTFNVNKNVSALARLNNYIAREQALTVCNAVILSNFNYCPLIWLFCNKGANKEIDRTHKRALRILYEDYESSFETLFTRSDSNSIHIKNLQKLMTEIYKSMNHLNAKETYNVQSKNTKLVQAANN